MPQWLERQLTKVTLYYSELKVEQTEPRVPFQTVARAFDSSFLSVRPDSEGRLFVGSRETLFVIEPNPLGGFEQPRALFRFPRDSWLNDIAIRGDDLYVITNAALYHLPNARVRREQVECKRLIWGIPLDLHVSFHALAWGPQGDLYFTAGDPYLQAGPQREVPDHWGFWTLFGPDDKPALEHVGSGGIFCCRPDGTQLRQIAGGLRGPFGLAFDPEWNLFVCDNDHESRPDRFAPARVLEVVPQADFGWPRGWTPANTPRRSDVWATATVPLGPGVPVGMVYHEGFDPEKPEGSLLLSRWESGVERLAVDPQSPEGMTPRKWLTTRDATRPLMLTVDGGGNVFVSLCQMIANEPSPHYPSEVRQYGPGSQTPLVQRNLTTASEEELLAELSAPRLVRRGSAHQELLRRGKSVSVAVLNHGRLVPKDDAARLHLPWIVAALTLPEAAAVVTECCNSDRRDLVLQGLRIAAEFPQIPVDPLRIRKHLSSTDERTQLAALAAGAKRGQWQASDYFEFVRNSESTRFLQVIGREISKISEAAEIAAACNDPSPRVRLATVLAAGLRATTPTVAEARSLIQPYPHANCRHQISYVDEDCDLTTLGPLGTLTTADLWTKSSGLGEKESLYQLLLARLHDDNDSVRFQAAHYLELLQDVRSQPLVNRVWLDADAQSVADRPFFPVTSGRVRVGLATDEEETAYQAADGRLFAQVATDASKTLRVRFRCISPVGQRAMIETNPAVRLVATVNDEGAASYESRLSAYLEPGTNDVVLRLFDVLDPQQLQLGLRSRLPVSIAEVPSLPTVPITAESNDATLEALREWLDSTSDGDLEQLVGNASAEEGRRQFGRDGAGCIRCHEIVAGGRGRGGPSLRNAKERLKLQHLADSIVSPSKAVDSKFRRTSLSLHDGRILRGLVVVEGDKDLILLLEDGRQSRIEKSSIDERFLETVSAMPTGLTRTRQGLLDLLAYLQLQQPEAP